MFLLYSSGDSKTADFAGTLDKNKENLPFFMIAGLFSG
jgi:hypothetical protein